MLGDVLIIQEKHSQAAAQLLEIITQAPGEKQVIAIGGESGSGKTEVAHELACLLKEGGTPAKIMHIDNYYQVPPLRRIQWRKTHGLEKIGPGEYNWDLINRNLEEFRADQDQVTMPCIDLLTDQVDTLHTSFRGLEYLIVEGLYAVQADADLRALIDLTYQQTKDMQYERGKEPVNNFRWQVLEAEHQAVQSLRPLTDLLVTSDFQVVELQS